MAPGRPTVYNPEKHLPILEAAAARGAHLEGLAAELGIGKRTFYDWIEVGGRFFNPEVYEVVQRIIAARDKRMTQLLEDLATGAAEKGNGGVAVFMAKNTLGWRDRSEVTSHNTNDNHHEVVVTIGGGARPNQHGRDEDQPES